MQLCSGHGISRFPAGRIRRSLRSLHTRKEALVVLSLGSLGIVERSAVGQAERLAVSAQQVHFLLQRRRLFGTLRRRQLGRSQLLAQFGAFRPVGGAVRAQPVCSLAKSRHRQLRDAQLLCQQRVLRSTFCRAQRHSQQRAVRRCQCERNQRDEDGNPQRLALADVAAAALLGISRPPLQLR